jgi:hypothetical protein
MRPAGLESNRDCADKCQQQFTGLANHYNYFPNNSGNIGAENKNSEILVSSLMCSSPFICQKNERVKRDKSRKNTILTPPPPEILSLSP